MKWRMAKLKRTSKPVPAGVTQSVMKLRYRVESDVWTLEGDNLLSPQNLALLKAKFAQSPLIVEHRFYRAASSPSRSVFEDFEEFMGYLNEKACAGDHIWIWDFEALCRDDNATTHGKCPADDGCVPLRGAY